MTPAGVETWGPDRLDELVALCDAALPAEALSADDLEGLCFAPDLRDPDGPLGETAVLARRDGFGAAIVSLRVPFGEAEPVGYVQLLVVHPARRRRGIARELIAAAEAWAAERGARAVQVGGAAPTYLFTGVDSNWLDAVCCFEALGYRRSAVELDMVCPTRTTRAPVPAGVVIGRIVDDADLEALGAWADRSWPWWSTEFTRAGRAGTVVVATEAGEDGPGRILGAAAHSVGRLGVVGPVAVDPGSMGGGVGSALMAAVLSELSVAGLDRAEISWVSTVRFYVRSCGARIGRASQILRRDVTTPSGAVASGV